MKKITYFNKKRAIKFFKYLIAHKPAAKLEFKSFLFIKYYVLTY